MIVEKERIRQADIASFTQKLKMNERCKKTLKKYRRDIIAFYQWLPADKQLKKELVMQYKAHIVEKYAVCSVNSMLMAIKRFLKYLGRADCAVKTLKYQRNLFCGKEKELTKEEYMPALQHEWATRRQVVHT